MMFGSASMQTSKRAMAAIWGQFSCLRWFSCSPFPLVKQMPPRRKLDPSEFTTAYIKGGGKGGQALNKTSSAVQLTHKATGIVVKAQPTRSRSQNLKHAMQILADKLDQMEKGDQSRAAIVAEVKKKRKASKTKKAKRKYRKLEEEKGRKMLEAMGVDQGAEAEEGVEGVEEGAVEENKADVESRQGERPVQPTAEAKPDGKE